jgi:hypothetical protein
MKKLIDHTGQAFGDWIVLKRAPINKERTTKWICECKCGAKHEVRGQHLREGNSTKCKTCYNKFSQSTSTRLPYVVGNVFKGWKLIENIIGVDKGVFECIKCGKKRTAQKNYYGSCQVAYCKCKK